MRFEEAVDMMDALGHPVRLRVVHILSRAGHEGVTVGRLVEEIGVAASTLSHHLSCLVKADLIVQERRATTLYCHVKDRSVNALAAYVTTLTTTGSRQTEPGRS